MNICASESPQLMMKAHLTLLKMLMRTRKSVTSIAILKVRVKFLRCGQSPCINIVKKYNGRLPIR